MADSANKAKNKHSRGSLPKWQRLLMAAAAVLLLLILSGGLYIVPEGQMATIIQFGKIIRTEENAGLHWKIPFIQSSAFLSRKMNLYDVQPSEVLTSDKKAMIVDSYALWRIDDATRFIRTVGSVPELQKRIDASVYSNIKNIMGLLQQDEIISDEEASRASLNLQVTEKIKKELANYGIEVLRVEIRRYDLPQDNLAAVYSRMISERQQMAAALKADGEYEAQKMRNDTDKSYEIQIGTAEAEARRLEGEGEAAYIATLKELYSDPQLSQFYRFMLDLDALKTSLGGEKTVILGPDSPLGQILAQGKSGE